MGIGSGLSGLVLAMSAVVCWTCPANFDSDSGLASSATWMPKTSRFLGDEPATAPRLDVTAEAGPTREAGQTTEDGTAGDALMQLASADSAVRIVRLDPATGSSLDNPPEAAAPLEGNPLENLAKLIDEGCLQSDECIDRYLWSIYEKARKVDTVKVSETIKVQVKKKGKVRTRSKVVTKFVTEDFSWKDPEAAEKAEMTMPAYVIGGMDRDFKARLYRLFRALEEADLEPGMTSGFRDDYRQSIASGNKAATGRSYHGGSMRGGYGHGLAADIISMKGETRAEREISTETLWKWVDEKGKQFGIGRPYLDRDPPHVGPIDGPEYLAKRLGKTKEASTQPAASPKAKLSKSE
jgi:hypothetical protein